MGYFRISQNFLMFDVKFSKYITVDQIINLYLEILYDTLREAQQYTWLHQ